MSGYDDSLFGNLPPSFPRGPFQMSPGGSDDPALMFSGPNLFPSPAMGPLSSRTPMASGQAPAWMPPAANYIQPLPAWISQAAQNYIRSRPSYSEAQAQGPTVDIAGNPTGPGLPAAQGEPYSPTPQLNDIRRLFPNRIRSNSPTPQSITPNPMVRKLMQLPSFAGFTGGTDI